MGGEIRKRFIEKKAYIDLADLCFILKIHPETARRYVREKRIPVLDLGRPYLFSREAIEKLKGKFPKQGRPRKFKAEEVKAEGLKFLYDPKQQK